MSQSIAKAVAVAEVNRVHDADECSADVVNKVHRLESVTVSMAKAAIGRAVKDAIGERGLKEFGHKGLMSDVISGEKVPDYMARIYEDPSARRRYALSLLKGDPRVKVRTVVEVDDEESA